MSYCLSPAKWRSLTKAQRQAALNDYASLEGYSGSDELTKELQEHVRKTTAPYKYPRIIEYVGELPKTISGKILRRELRRG